MNAWQTVLLTFGGNAILLGVLAWLARSILQHWLSKDVESFKATIAATNAAATERLRHELQIAATEHQVRFSKLHDRRAEVIAELYGLLVEAQRALRSFVSPWEGLEEPKKNEKYVEAMNKTVRFYRYFDKNKIFLPAATCDQLDGFVGGMRSEAIGFGMYVNDESLDLQADVSGEKLQAWVKAYEYFSDEAPKARRALEDELRSILGATAGGVS